MGNSQILLKHQTSTHKICSKQYF